MIVKSVLYIKSQSYELLYTDNFDTLEKKTDVNKILPFSHKIPKVVAFGSDIKVNWLLLCLFWSLLYVDT